MTSTLQTAARYGVTQNRKKEYTEDEDACKMGTVVLTCDPINEEAEAGELQDEG